MGITTHVCAPNPTSNAPDKAYNVSEFKYNNELDYYTCPAGETLKTNGNWYRQKGISSKTIQNKKL